VLARALMLRAVLACNLLLIPASAQASPPLSLQPQDKGVANFPRYTGPISAETTVSLGLEQSLAVALSRTQLRQLEADVAEARSAARPQASISGLAIKGNLPMIYQTTPGITPNFLGTYPDSGELSANAMLMYPLFTGGALEHRIDAAEHGQKGAVARVALALWASARQIRSAYYLVQVTRANQVTLAWELTQTQEMERLAGEQLRSGKVAPYILLRAEMEVANTRQRVNEAAAELEQREAEIKVAMGVAVDSEFQYPETEPIPESPAALSELLATELAERSDLVSARQAVKEGDGQLSAAISEYAPKAYLVGMARSQDALGQNKTGYSAGLVVSFPLFDSGLRRAHESKARASRDERQVRLRQMELEATSQVVTDRAQLVATLENLQLSQVEIDNATEEWRISRLRLEAGRVIYVEVLDALTSLVRARNNRNKALYAAATARAELLYAIGRY
jgi:outer membrane protein TolC